MFELLQGFIRQAAHILAPLVNFLKGIRNKKRPKRNVKIKPEEVLQWTDGATTAFELVKQVLAHATLLHHPMPKGLGTSFNPFGLFFGFKILGPVPVWPAF
ncbi:transposon Tf2-6 polyprotein [Trichonephila inaurata madagascariensis]|uniref:Transposon Tf2-6 polyprotein n=1 Tax=Trichonephila inaurata madagascariensis TaxID=2747483 RepID=A0A8X6YR82_9ARAC|nr:transposon Tf2-6 polyprotein [Trichonephila inaurata madagascariensis]